MVAELFWENLFSVSLTFTFFQRTLTHSNYGRGRPEFEDLGHLADAASKIRRGRCHDTHFLKIVEMNRGHKNSILGDKFDPYVDNEYGL
jgi:hypothetical protein